MLTLALTPEGVAVFEGGAGSAAERRLLQAESPPVMLAGELLTAELEPSLRWLRELGRRFLIRLCQTKDATRIAPLTEDETAALLACAPPFPGAEHLSAELLERWWREMTEHIAAEAAGDVVRWLGAHGPDWHAVGRVTFHLAENRTDTLRPFAFLATFTEKLGDGGRPQHLPLARALQLYAGQRDPTALNALLEPVRLAAGKSPLVREWLESKRLFQAVAMTPQEAWRVLREAALLQECGIIMKLPDWWRQGRTARPLVQVTLEAPGKAALNAHSLLGFSISRSLDGEPLGEDEWGRLMSAETGLVSLRGRWVEADGEKLRQVMAHWRRVQEAAGEGGVGFLQGMRLLAGFDQARAEVADEGGARVAEWSNVKAGEMLAEVLQKLREPQEEPPPEGLCAVLRPYQLRGYNWLRFMTRAGLGACLADDMGLGKTLQVIALLLARRMEAAPPALLVVPASLIGNWRAEVARFAPDLRMFIAHPSVQPRETLELAACQPAEALGGHDVMLTTYQMLQRTEAWLEHGWSLVVLDEAQAVKNSGGAAAKAVKRLKATARVALTGTPVENRPGDLWSLFDFLNPGLLGGATAFAEAVKRCAGSKEGYAPLRRLVQPFILRRMKTDRSIISDLPEKIELKAFCGLTKRQATIYAKLTDQLAKMLNDPNMQPAQRQGLVLGFLLKFKQVCNHPSHWNGDGAWNAADSGKFARLAEIAAEIAAKRERVLVFTQFQEVCEPLARFLAGVFGREGLVLHGGTPVSRRPHLVEAFQKPGGPPFMVISVKAGGTGLNLTAASQVVHFDRWWNPAVENQATDRAFRIGQKRSVIVHKFICQGTLEQRIDALIDDKLALARDLVGEASGAEQSIAGMSDDELLDLVRLDVRSLLDA